MISPRARSRVYIAGGPAGDSVGPIVHEHLAKSLGLDWTCEFLRLSSIDEVMKIFRAPDFAGGLVTMPHKRTVIPLLDHYDDLVKILGACNVVYLTPEGALHGTNTDWAGICDAILANSPHHVHGRTAMVYGAGGASRAAIYALWTNLKFSRIYLVNRDDQEVKELLEDIHRQGDSYQPELQHVRTVLEARQLPPPSCIVTTVPDYEAVTPGEIEARDILIEFLQRDNSAKELVLDMCYHPLMTRNLQLAEKFGWKIVQGFTVVAHQFSLQWKAWTSRDIEEDVAFRLTESLVKEREKTRIQ